MKLTKEQANAALESWGKWAKPSLRSWLESYEFPDPQLPENATQWIHCSEGLPTEEDAGHQDYVFWLAKTDDGRAWIPYRVKWNHPAHSEDFWWMPVPKNLTPPPPKDPFEEWWKNNWLTTQNPNARNLARSAFEAGKQSK